MTIASALRVRGRRISLAALAALLCLPALPAAADPSPAAPAPAAPSPPGARAVSWVPCDPPDEGARCGSVAVPVNWDHPSASGSAQVRIAVRPARDRARRVGVLMFNPGGPGAGAADIAAREDWAEFWFPSELLDRFDVVGVDPRGVPGSTPVVCADPVDPEVSRFPRTPAEARRLSEANSAFAASCLKGTGPLAAHLDTDIVARDLDAVRAALGEPTISFLGVSYGTMLAQAYAERYPSRVRALVLDGVVDRSLPPARLVLDGAAAVQDGLARFAARCAATEACVLRGKDVTAELRRMDARAERGEVRAGGRAVTAEELRLAVNDGLNTPLADGMLAAGIRDAVDRGDGTALTSLSRYQAWSEYARYRAIICQDVPRARATALVGLADAAGRRGPVLRGASEMWDIVSGCAGWPGPSRWTPHAWRVPATVTPLLLSGAHDVATPRRWAESVHRGLPGSTLVRWDGDGHAAWPAHNRCAMRAAVTYLTDLTPPASTTCPADQAVTGAGS
ncbi:alpha/beta hydrolase [Microtetraspora niveoalba]|uniref:alpha/beta hydrolase n=1 Tax=Microtetraspora niveoalba TaxID=46175 RepID=UPI00147198BB|nr:alpha/beta hydrolase [Microtetraspora niveoalba]